ncbi:MAG: DUF4147 domain-containing protein [Planctomycetaceae bacterium]|jgi:hydroxypyruvate reductase|nr:DUF4147 domain-containing protein [Planctomycetaceae bacterium]
MREDLFTIWNAGIRAVLCEPLIRRAVVLNETTLRVGQKTFPLDSIDRIVVIGGGKASGAMAEALENVLEPLFAGKKIEGWVNVPNDCAKPLRKIHLHPARPAGINEPTAEAVAGTGEIIKLAKSLTANDLCICLISGGGSALLCAPAAGITLEKKIAVVRKMSAEGASIRELNAVRKKMSKIKGGQLAKIGRNKRMVSLILSDVPGDPPEVIASGPTVETKGDPAHHHFFIGNLAKAVYAAAEEAKRLGYTVRTRIASRDEGTAESVGFRLMREAWDLPPGTCLISGGEPVVKLVPPEKRGKGGRNQQLALAALSQHLEKIGDEDDENWGVPVAFLSGGTDGEDGPTDAAGAWFDNQALDALGEFTVRDGSPDDYLGRNDAYRFFEKLGTLLKTGATGTNVCDLRIILRG